MKQNLKQYFENNNKNKLDSQTKNFLYTKISRQIHKNRLFLIVSSVDQNLFL
jgi:hypothetical protein